MIDFVARLITPINIGTLPNEVNKRRHLKWDTGTLKDCVNEYFDESPVLTFERLRLPKAFDAWSLCKVGGIKIRFTDNLADHLLLVEDDAIVLIFHHVTYLEQQGQNSQLPPGLAEETIKTIALLFPQAEYGGSKKSTRKKRAWLSKLCKNHENEYGCRVDECVNRCGGLPASERQIERFRFWRDRLGVLKQTYDETTPSTISQWWHDRRNGPQWFTFWVAGVALALATLALFLTVVQAVEGALQVFLAYNPKS
ncbi:hypothetical protein J7T55_014484 [Diaporthe amygdali]|uniref:uncharacterized protein n=1 Tax=Phomopsis amygdali TaxID=1214568 RepID=UPI0022FDFDB1|nr:uncharacterized protein J7T55_014484 [Diaporthe amygdali]KAJ0118031.1 hypothetical protein J7T55_014484 [Diaporthe amygdali]